MLDTDTERDSNCYWYASSDKFDKRPAAGHICTLFVSVTVHDSVCFDFSGNVYNESPS